MIFIEADQLQGLLEIESVRQTKRVVAEQTVYARCAEQLVAEQLRGEVILQAAQWLVETKRVLGKLGQGVLIQAKRGLRQQLLLLAVLAALAAAAQYVLACGIIDSKIYFIF